MDSFVRAYVRADAIVDMCMRTEHHGRSLFDVWARFAKVTHEVIRTVFAGHSSR